MVDFSTVSLRILSPDGNKVLAELNNIDQRGQQVGRSMREFSPRMNEAAIATRRVASELSMVAARGEVGMLELKGLAIEAGNVALGFGPQGAIAGAVALTAVGIYEMFHRTRDEIDQTQKKALQAIGELANAGDSAKLQKQMRDVLYGQPFDDEGKLRAASERVHGAFEGSLADLEAWYAAFQRTHREAAMVDPAVNEKLRELERLREKFASLKQATLNIANQPPANAGTLSTATVKALAPGVLTAEEERQLQKHADLIASAFYGFIARGMELADQHSSTVPVANPADIARNALKQARIEAVGAAMSNAASRIGQTFGDSLTAGIVNAFSRGGNVGTAFAAMGASILSAIGAMFEQIGVAALAGMALMARIKAALIGFAPEIGIPAALGLIALGAVLQGAGGRMSSNATPHGGGGGGYGGGYGNVGTSTYVGVLNAPYKTSGANMTGLRATQPVNINNPVFIGVRDPAVQRDFLQLIRYARERGDV